jgi:hypothetical protein
LSLVCWLLRVGEYVLLLGPLYASGGGGGAIYDRVCGSSRRTPILLRVDPVLFPSDALLIAGIWALKFGCRFMGESQSPSPPIGDTPEPLCVYVSRVHSYCLVFGPLRTPLAPSSLIACLWRMFAYRLVRVCECACSWKRLGVFSAYVCSSLEQYGARHPQSALARNCGTAFCHTSWSVARSVAVLFPKQKGGISRSHGQMCATPKHELDGQSHRDPTAN